MVEAAGLRLPGDSSGGTEAPSNNQELHGQTTSATAKCGAGVCRWVTPTVGWPGLCLCNQCMYAVAVHDLQPRADSRQLQGGYSRLWYGNQRCESNQLYTKKPVLRGCPMQMLFCSAHCAMLYSWPRWDNVGLFTTL